MDEWQKSLDYIRGSNIYVRGYLDLRAWSLRLRAQTEENHYGKALFSSRERCFSHRWMRGILAIRRRACVSLRRGISGSWACGVLAGLIEDRTLCNSHYLEVRLLLLYLCSRKSGGRAANDRVQIESGNEKVSLKIWWNENFALPLHSQKKRTAQR